MPPQFRETIASSVELDVGNTSVGIFGKAAAGETKTNDDKATNAIERTTEDENDIRIETPQFLSVHL